MAAIYRHKFSPEFMNILKEWVSIHKFDDNESFVDNWNTWCRTNEMSIEREKEKLEENGCNKDIYTKMFKTVRYYLKNKSDVKKKPKQRRQYISLDKDFIESIDSHIIINANTLKPQKAYENYINDIEHKELIDNAIEELKLTNLTEDNINEKIKKTYKNRYFIFKKRK